MSTDTSKNITDLLLAAKMKAPQKHIAELRYIKTVNSMNVSSLCKFITVKLFLMPLFF